MKAANATASFVLALFLALTAAMVIAAAVEAPPSLMSRADRLAALQQIERDARLALARCRGLDDPGARAVCRAQARAAERIAAATLEASYLGTVGAYDRVERVETRAVHSVGMALRLAPT